MASQAEYSAVANALVKLMLFEEHKLPPWEQSFIPQDKIPAAAGAAAKVAVDTLDEYRRKPAAFTPTGRKRKRR